MNIVNVEKGKIILLENDCEYYVIDNLYLDGKTYLYLSKLEPENGDDLFFAEIINDQIYRVFNEEIIKMLFKIVSGNK